MWSAFKPKTCPWKALYQVPFLPLLSRDPVQPLSQVIVDSLQGATSLRERGIPPACYFTPAALVSVSCFSLGKFISLLHLINPLLTPLSPKISSCFMRSGMFTSCKIKEIHSRQSHNVAHSSLSAWTLSKRRHLKTWTSLGCFQSGTPGFTFLLGFL